MAKPKNGKAKRIYKEQAQVQAVQHEEIKAQQRKSSTRFNRCDLLPEQSSLKSRV
jgi:hypothetical protein